MVRKKGLEIFSSKGRLGLETCEFRNPCSLPVDFSASTCTFRTASPTIKRYCFQSASITGSISPSGRKVGAIEYFTRDTVLLGSFEKTFSNWDQRENKLEDQIFLNQSPQQIIIRGHTLMVCGYREEMKRFDLRYLSQSKGHATPVTAYEGVGDKFHLSPSGGYLALVDTVKGKVKIYDTSKSKQLTLDNQIQSIRVAEHLPPFPGLNNESLLVLQNSEMTLWELHT